MATLARMHVEIGANTKGLVDGLNSVQGKVASVGQSMSRMGRTLTTRVSAPLAAVGAASFKLAADLETSFAKMEGLVGVSRTQLDAWEGDIQDLAVTYGVSATKAADALFFITSAGLEGSDAMDALEASMKASAAGLGQVSTIADLATSAMNAYGPAVLGATQATDVLTAAVREGKLAPDELAGSMGRVIPIASAMGIRFDEVGAAMAAMSRTGTGANEAATQLRSIMTGLLKPTKEAQDALSAMGLSAGGLRSQIREQGLLSVLQTLAAEFEGNDEAAAKVFGNVRALSGVLDLMGSNAEATAGIFDSMEDTTGALDAAFEAMSETASFKLNQAIQAGAVLLTKLGNAIIPPVVSMLEKTVDALVPVANWFEKLDPRIQRAVVVVGALATALGPALVALGAAATALGALSAPVAAVIAAVGAMGAAWVLFGDEIKAVWSAVSPVLQAIMTVQKAVAKVVLNAVDIMVGMAFVAWRKGLQDTWKAWKIVSGAIMKIAKAIADAVTEFLVKHFEPVVEMVIEFIEMIEGAWSWLKERVTGETVPRMSRELGGLFERMKRVTTSATDTTTTDIAADFEGMGTDVVNSTANMATGVASEIDNMESLVVPKMQRVGKAVFDAYDDHMDDIVSSTDQTTDDVVDLLGDMEIEAPEIVGRMGTGMREEYEDATSGIVDDTVGFVDDIVTEFEGLEEGILGAVEKIPGPLGDTLTEIAEKFELSGTIGDIKTNITNWVDTAIAIVDALKQIWDFIKDKGGEFLGFLGNLSNTGGRAEFGQDPTGGGVGLGGLGPQGPLPPPAIAPSDRTGAQQVHLLGTLVSQVQIIHAILHEGLILAKPEFMQQFRSMNGFLSTLVARMNAAMEQLKAQTSHLATMVGAGSSGTVTSGAVVAGTGGMAMAGAGAGAGGGVNVNVNFLAPVSGISEEALADLVAERVTPEIDAALGRRRRAQRSSVGTLRSD